MIWKLNKGCQNTASADMDTCSEYKSEQKEGSHMLNWSTYETSLLPQELDRIKEGP